MLTTNEPDDATLPLHLTVLEVIFLADNLRVDDTDEGNPQAPSHMRGTFIGRSLLRKIGSLYIEFANQTGNFDFSKYAGEDLSAPITVTEAEAWLMKGRIRTGDLAMDGQTNIGVELSCKLFELVNRFDTVLPSQIPLRSDAVGDHKFTRFDARDLRDELMFQELLEAEEEADKKKGKTDAEPKYFSDQDHSIDKARSHPRKTPHPAPPDLP